MLPLAHFGRERVDPRRIRCSGYVELDGRFFVDLEGGFDDSVPSLFAIAADAEFILSGSRERNRAIDFAVIGNSLSFTAVRRPAGGGRA